MSAATSDGLCPRCRFRAARLAHRGIRVTVTVRRPGDLKLLLSVSESTAVELPDLGVELEGGGIFTPTGYGVTYGESDKDRRPGADSALSTSCVVSVEDVVSRVTAVLAPSLGGLAGQQVLGALDRCRGVGVGVGTAAPAEQAAEQDWEPWTLVAQDSDGHVDVPGLCCDCCAGRERHCAGDNPRIVSVAAVPSFRDRMPYHLKRARLNTRAATVAAAAAGLLLSHQPTLAASDGEGDPRAPGPGSLWPFRVVEQAGRGIGAVTFAGTGVLATHLATCWPAGFWKGKKVLELGAGAGLLGVVLAALGADVTVTDRRECLDLIELNVMLNAGTVAAAGGTAVARELEWGSTGWAAFLEDAEAPPRFDFVVGSDIVYPHEKDGVAARSALAETLQALLLAPPGALSDAPRTAAQPPVALIHHSERFGSAERAFFTEMLPGASFAVTRTCQSRYDGPNPVLPGPTSPGPECRCGLTPVGLELTTIRRAVSPELPATIADTGQFLRCVSAQLGAVFDSEGLPPESPYSSATGARPGATAAAHLEGASLAHAVYSVTRRT